jgi:hypothetical protein
MALKKKTKEIIKMSLGLREYERKQIVASLTLSMLNEISAHDAMNDPNKTLCCAECGNDNIEWRVWADESNKVKGSCEDSFVYCNSCEDETTSVIK